MIGASVAPAAKTSRRAVPQPRSVSRASARPSSARSPSAILPRTGSPSRSAPDRPLRARLDGDTDAVERPLGRRRRALRDARGVPGARARVAAPARGRRLVVEAALQELHPAAVGALVLEHVLLLGLAGGGDALVPLGVVGPRLSGGHPAALDPPDGTVDVEHLEQQLQGRAADVDARLERGRRQAAVPTARRSRAAPGPRRASRPSRSTARCPGPPGRAAAARRRSPSRGRHDPPAGSSDTGDEGAPRCSTKPRSGLSKPMPSALVATRAFTVLALSAASDSSRSAGSVWPV